MTWILLGALLAAAPLDGRGHDATGQWKPFADQVLRKP